MHITVHKLRYWFAEVLLDQPGVQEDGMLGPAEATGLFPILELLFAAGFLSGIQPLVAG